MRTLEPSHQDYIALNRISEEVLQRAGDLEGLSAFIPAMLRQVIDDVIKTPKTGRRSYDELEKTEKTYIGTLVEIELRNFLALKRGRFDLVIECEEMTYDVDVKTTLAGNWMIPQEVLGYPCVLVSASERTGLCSVGVVVARREYLTSGENRDRKLQISAAARSNIWWWLKDEPYPANFWKDVPSESIERIFSAASGNARTTTLFRELIGRVISRSVIEAVALQKDFMRRVRADGSRGTRATLAREGIVLLSGAFDAQLISELGLAPIQRSEFVAYKLLSQDQFDAARRAGHKV